MVRIPTKSENKNFSLKEMIRIIRTLFDHIKSSLDAIKLSLSTVSGSRMFLNGVIMLPNLLNTLSELVLVAGNANNRNASLDSFEYCL